MRPVSRRSAARLGLLLSVLSLGCRPTELRLCLRSDVQVNGGRALVVLLRSVAGTQPSRTERYGDVERLVTTPDASVLRLVSVPPGLAKRLCVRVPYPPAGAVSLSALYGVPVADWRVYFAAPAPDRIELFLGPTGIDRSQIREHRPLRLPRLPKLPAGLPPPPSAPSLEAPAAPAVPAVSQPSGGSR